MKSVRYHEHQENINFWKSYQFYQQILGVIHLGRRGGQTNSEQALFSNAISTGFVVSSWNKSPNFPWLSSVKCILFSLTNACKRHLFPWLDQNNTIAYKTKNHVVKQTKTIKMLFILDIMSIISKFLCILNAKVMQHEI